MNRPNKQVLMTPPQQDQSVIPYDDLVRNAPTFEIQTAFTKGYTLIAQVYDNIVVSTSGGADSDVVIDFVEKLLKYSPGKHATYIFFDTGMEFQATKDHLKFLEEKYGITIHRQRAAVPVPLGVYENGQPFLSKRVSEYMERLQRHNFKWEDRPFEELYKEYPKCKAALRWWCNEWGEGSQINISHWAYLKEFIVTNPPTFKISAKCCDGAKKKTAKQFQENVKADLSIQGVRKAEGGIRSTAIKSCFSEKMGEMGVYRPIFWFKNSDKKAYCDTYDVTHSRCYTQYELPRTGCACCPFGSNFENELKAAEKYEPKLYKAACKVFGESYEYTRAYRRFKDEQRERKIQDC